ncbi:helix-turn-helix domain-containing protein [Kribbella monticola]|uniref:helix-turn-helix domain-containing protein n=1 Tax=Kribbella monticola TaxID=2185285 RepID=UPI000DD45184|nr:helix-turn-helix transcriptional regulator [Kribbella monticola]
MATTALGEYLSARRAQVAPEQLGRPTHGVRRVPGLRREEVAMAAGMSVDYYIRLEQGRERNPSAQVLDALSEVLRLDDDAHLHLFRLAGLLPAPTRPAAVEQVDPQLLRLMEMWPANPAIVLGRAFDILAGNAAAYALFDGFQQGPNLMAKIFLDPDARSFYPDWEEVARYTVAGFRLQQGRSPDDPRIRQVIEELSHASPDFVAFWERHEARGTRMTSKRFHHREAGELTLQINAFDVLSAPGQELIVYHAEPDTPSAAALARLTSNAQL